jgi:putative membrane protein
MATSIASASAKDKPSEAFLKKAIEGNFAEVSMGDLAQKNGQSDGVKSYGKMLSTDHASANQKALDAAKGLGMNPPTGPNAKQKADYDKMSKMSGAGFDKMFATHMVADHQKDIAEYKKASTIKDAAGEYASGQIAETFGHRKIVKTRQVIPAEDFLGGSQARQMSGAAEFGSRACCTLIGCSPSMAPVPISHSRSFASSR